MTRAEFENILAITNSIKEMNEEQKWYFLSLAERGKKIGYSGLLHYTLEDDIKNNSKKNEDRN